jgi:hypothetical protein
MRWIVSSLVVFAFLGCGGDDDGGAGEACVPDTPCTCPVNTSMGITLCRDDGTMSCSGCPTAPVAGAGGTTPVGTAGTGGATGSNGGRGGAGGMSGMGGMGGAGGRSGAGGTTDQDGGTDDDGGSVTAGAQNAPCSGDTCDPGLSCYAMNHCSLDCTDDTDCDSLNGATYTCGNNGQCRVDCADDTDCTGGLSCEMVGNNMRCLLP